MTAELREALIRGRSERDAERLDAALDWFERAARLAPEDAGVRLDLAQLLVMRGDPRGLALYRALCEGSDLREAWLGLAVAALGAGEAGEAAAALAHGLADHAHDADAIAAIADALARGTGAAGWCAIDGVGGLVVGAVGQERPRASLDGKMLRLAARPAGRLAARLPAGWERAGVLTVTSAGRALLGSPIAIGRIMRVEGFVESVDGDLRGWAWYPRAPDRDPVLTITPRRGAPIRITASDETAAIAAVASLARPRAFHLAPGELARLAGPLAVGGDGRAHLTGSPLDPSLEQASAVQAAQMAAHLFPAPGAAPAPLRPNALAAAPAHVIGGPPRGGVERRGVDVVIPVHGGLRLALDCIASARVGLPHWARLVVVDDASPDPAVVETLARMAGRGEITLLAQAENRGFPASVNIGMRHDPSRDVVLLNSDTLLPPGWLERLRDAAYSAPAIGTATPLSNDATILSYPSVETPNAIPDLAETIRLDAQARRAAPPLVEIPTAIGFCMYIKRDCLDAVGLFREDVFAQGYGEENDFCIRARHLGWRHVAAPAIFVAHVGGQSFGAAKAHLVRRNMRLINRLHPGYDALVAAFQRADPMSSARRALDCVRWAELRDRRRSVLLVTHGRAGGVQRRVAERAAALRAEGLRPIVIWPVERRGGAGRDCVLGDGPEGGTPNLRFAVPEELAELAALLRQDRPLRAEIHHLIGHDHTLFKLFTRLRIPYEIVIHDYSWFCPRINLVGVGNRYCGEPPISGCEACIADLGTTNDEATPPAELVRRSAGELAGAGRVIVPSRDVASRMRRHFPAIAPEAEPWEDDAALPPPAFYPLVGGAIRVCLVGAIGIEKGYEILLACARDAAERRLPLAFRLVGHSSDDARLLATGKVHITGRYQEHEVLALIRAQSAQLAWLPSLWPETWCYTLTEAWKAGLPVAAFDLGAPAERIRATGRGWLVPPALPPIALNQRLMRFAEQAVAVHVRHPATVS